MKKGFTLIEILVALVILALGLVIVFNLFPLGLQSLAYSRKLNEVSFLAQKKLEEVKTQGINPAEKSGKEGDLNWAISAQPLKLAGDVEVTSVQLDIYFKFLGRQQKQRFVTYFTKD